MPVPGRLRTRLLQSGNGSCHGCGIQIPVTHVLQAEPGRIENYRRLGDWRLWECEHWRIREHWGLQLQRIQLQFGGVLCELSWWRRAAGESQGYHQGLVREYAGCELGRPQQVR